MKQIDPLPDNDPSRDDSSVGRPNSWDKGREEAKQLLREQIQSAYQHNNRAAAGSTSSNEIEQRPDPQVDRAAYEAWYYRQTPAAQQAEWDLYYSKHRNKPLIQKNPEHAVGKHFAHEHVIPEEEQNFGSFSIPNEKHATILEEAQAQNQAAEQEASSHTATLPEIKSPSEIARTKATLALSPLKSFLAMGLVALIISLALFNEVVIGQVRSYISPASTVSTPIILDPSVNVEVGDEPRIIIPKINVDVPVVYNLGSLEESAIQVALNDGVVDYEYPKTVQPGQIGNNVIVGHSSNNFLNSGKYKFAFVLLDRLEEGDSFILHYKGERFVYRVFNKQTINPTDFKLIDGATDKPITTLITCTPPGTSWKRLVIQGEQISPKVETAKKATPATTEQPETETIVPGNSQTLWDRITNIF